MEGLHAEAEAAGGAAAQFMTSLSPGGRQVHMMWVDIQVARAVRENLEASGVIASLPLQVIEPEDLAL